MAGRPAEEARFRDRFVELFDGHFPELFRYLDRLTADPDLAADLAQEAFIRLYRRGALPDRPRAWLLAVAMNLFRNTRSARSRRRALLTAERGERSLADPPPSPAASGQANQAQRRVRAALNALPERERALLLLRSEGYGYRDMAAVLALNEASIGTLLARARRAFRAAYEVADHAP